MVSEQTFGGLSDEQKKKLAALKTDLEKSGAKDAEIEVSQKSESGEAVFEASADDMFFKLADEERELQEKLAEAETEAEKQTLSAAIGKNKLERIRWEEKDRGIKFKREDIAEIFGKTPEEAEKIIEKFEGGKVEPEKFEKKEAADKKISPETEKQQIAPKTGAKEQAAPAESGKEKLAGKPRYSEDYLLYALEESKKEGDKKLIAYYQFQLEEFKKKTAEKRPVKKTEQPLVRQPAEKAPVVPEKPMPKFEQMPPTTGEGGKKEEIPPKAEAKKEEKPAVVGTPAETPGPVETSADKPAEAKEKMKTITYEEQIAQPLGEKSETARKAEKEKEEEEFPLGAEAAVRPEVLKGIGEKRPERTEEEKKERAEKYLEIKKAREEAKKARSEYVEKAKEYDKYQTLLGKIKGVFKREEASKVKEECEAARGNYEKLRVDFIGKKLMRLGAEEMILVKERQDARAKENKTFEKIRSAYKWLGDQNLEKVFKPETKTGKIICRAASLRTAVGLGLGVTGFGLALSGGTAAAVGSALFLRKLYSGAASGLATYEGLRLFAEKRTAISDEQIKNLDLKDCAGKMAELESWAVLNGKKLMENPDYVKIRSRRQELLAADKGAKMADFAADQFKKLNLEIEKRNRGEMYRKVAALGVGAFVGSGAMARMVRYAAGGIFGSAEPIETLKPQTGLSDKSQEFLMGSKFNGASYVETAQKGSSLWKMTEHQLQAHYGAKFSSLNPAQKTWMIDYYKDIVAKNPAKFGFENIDVVKPGKAYDFSALFNEQAGFEKALGKAMKLTPDQMHNILRNNQILREWVLKNPGKPLTSELVEKLLKAPKGSFSGAIIENQVVVKPSGVTLQEVIAQETMERATTGRILNNLTGEIGFTLDEYKAIKGVSLRKLLEQAHWDNWNAGTMDLPHDGVYGGIEAARQIKLAEMIRSMNPSGAELDMPVDEYLKGAVKSGKFVRGTIEEVTMPAGAEAAPSAKISAEAPVEASPETRATAAAAEPKGEVNVIEAGSVAPLKRMSNFIYNNEGKVVGMENVHDIEGGQKMMKDGWFDTLRENARGKDFGLARTVVENRARQIAGSQKLLEQLVSEGKGDSAEADYLRKFIKYRIESTEKQYGDVYK